MSFAHNTVDRDAVDRNTGDRDAVIVWFREDLRLTDNPALIHAVQSGLPVLPLFILEQDDAGADNGSRAAPSLPRAHGAASLWWLHESLNRLAAALGTLRAPLILRKGDPREILTKLVRTSGAKLVAWNRRYGEREVAIDKAIMADLKRTGIAVQSFNARLLAEPWELKTKSGTPFRVYTPFRRALESQVDVRKPLPAPTSLRAFNAAIASDTLTDWHLQPTKPNWASDFGAHWSPGEAGAEERLDAFVNEAVLQYGEQRDFPAVKGTSGLSPYLRFGEISPQQIWHRVLAATTSASTAPKTSVATFLSEIIWRDFSYHLLWLHPTLASDNFQAKFDHFSWQDDAQAALKAWQHGKTGYPIVDAAMRQLWQTGWMHNRLRMIVGSFLVKHLLIDWRAGERWFWDTLLDADPASNPASWQWVAGCGADAAPYFRIFNPFGQGEKFDRDGSFVRRFVPELTNMPAKYIHRPWDAPKSILEAAGVTLGRTYPHPIVDHAFARERALNAFAALKTHAAA